MNKNLMLWNRFIWLVPVLWTIVIYFFMKKKGYKKVLTWLKHWGWEIPKIIIGTLFWIIWKLVTKIKIFYWVVMFMVYKFSDVIYKLTPKGKSKGIDAELFNEILYFSVLKPLQTLQLWLSFVFLGDLSVKNVKPFWNIITALDLIIIMGAFIAFGDMYMDRKRTKENNEMLRRQKNGNT